MHLPETVGDSGTSLWEKYLHRPASVDDREFNGVHPTCAAFYHVVRVETKAPAAVYAAFGRPNNGASLKDVVGTRPELWPIKMSGRDSHIHYSVLGDYVYYYYKRDSADDVVVRLQPAR